MGAISNLGNISSTIDFLRKNEKRGDKIDVDDYGVDYGNGYKQIPFLNNSQCASQDIQFQVTNALLWIIKGLEIIIETNAVQPLLEDNGGGGAQLIISYPQTESGSAVITRAITLDIENEGLLGLLRLCETVGDLKWDSKDYTTILGNKYIFGFLNLNYVPLDADQSLVSLKQIRIQTNDKVTINLGTNIYIKPIGWKLMKNQY